MRTPSIRMTGAVLALLATALVSAQEPRAPGQAEGPAVIFRAEVNYVEVDAFVTDADGRVVSDLSQDDFEVREDGRLQKISAFAFVDIPVARAERALFTASPIVPDVSTNEQVEGRVYLLVLDDNHTDPGQTARVKTIAREFVERRVGANDLVAIASTSGRSDASQEFTNNRALMLRAIDAFVGRKFQSATVTRLASAGPDENGVIQPGDDLWQEQRYQRARQSLTVLRRLGEVMVGVQGRRKAMIVIGEGLDYDLDSVTGPAGASASELLQDARAAIAAATRGNVAIYAIDPRGLEGPGAPLISVGTVLNDQGVGLASVTEERLRSSDSLRVLASGTGGFAAVNRNDLSEAFDRIVAENSRYYLLGYYPADSRRDGRFRTLDVRVTRPGLQVRARPGYHEGRGRPVMPPQPRGNLSAAVADALASPLPVAGLPIAFHAAPFKGPDGNAAVALSIELDLSQVPLSERNGGFGDTLEVAFAAYDARGTFMPGDRHAVALNMKPDTWQRVRENGFRVLSQMTLPAGRFQLRAAASVGGRAGSVIHDLDIPDFMELPLSMSGVALTSASSLRMATVKPKDPLKDYLPSPATARREFARGDVLVLFTELYERALRGQSHILDFKAELRSDEGRVVGQVVDERSSAELKGSAGGYGFTVQFSLADVDPGLYVLRVEGKSRADAGQPSISRDIQVRVR